MNSLRFGTVLAVAIVLGLLGHAVAQDDATGNAATQDAAAKDETGKGKAEPGKAEPGKDEPGAPNEASAEVDAVCKNPQCSVIVGAWQQDIKACIGKSARLKQLEGEIEGLQGKSTELAACSTGRDEAEKRAKEAGERAEGLAKELDTLKQATAASGDAQKYVEAVEKATAWKETADRIKEEADAARKEVADLKAEIAGIKDKPDGERGMKHVDASPPAKVDEVALGELEQKNRKLQEILDDTRRVLVEKEREKEASDGAISQMLADLVDLLGRTFECASFSVEMKNGTRVLKGTVGDTRARDEAWRMVLDSPLARLVHSSEIDVTGAGGQVCFVKTRAPGWLMARSRDKSDGGGTLFLRFSLDPGVVQMLPQVSDHAECETLGAVVKALEPLEPRPGEPAVWVRGSSGAVTQCYAAADGWKLRYRVPDRDGKWPAWILLRESDQGSRDAGGGGAVRP